MWKFWINKTKRDRALAETSHIEVTEIKQRGSRAVSKANQDIKRLNDLLKANGITLRIYIAAGGKRGH